MMRMLLRLLWVGLIFLFLLAIYRFILTTRQILRKYIR